MDQLKRLPEVTDHVLADLRADDSLKNRILLSASENQAGNHVRFRTAFALCSLSIALVLFCVFAAVLLSPQKDSPDMHVIPAGGHRVVSPVNLQSVIDQITEIQNGDME